MSHAAPTDHPIHEVLTGRYSPYVFDAGRSVSQADLQSIFEAARWTMSCYNEQPWRYIVGVRERDASTWEQVLECLVEGNQAWAQHAPVLGLGLTRKTFERNGKDNPAARHDLGAASANLTVEAVARGLQVHQMLGIVPDRAIELFELSGTRGRGSAGLSRRCWSAERCRTALRSLRRRAGV